MNLCQLGGLEQGARAPKSVSPECSTRVSSEQGWGQQGASVYLGLLADVYVVEARVQLQSQPPLTFSLSRFRSQ